VPGLSDGITTCLFDLDGVLTQMAKVDAKAEPYPDAVAFVKHAKPRGLRRAVVSSSANAQEVLIAAGIDDLFEARIDGIVAEREDLAGKPAPDTFLAGARAVGAEPAQAAVFEDAEAGVEAGRAGHFGLVVGVDRTAGVDRPGGVDCAGGVDRVAGDDHTRHGEALGEHGADIVVRQLTELLERS
jgi:HAD superfamily hydrolase (TIGR01509 family)